MNEGFCIHFNGIQNQSCDAKHKYLEVARPLNQDEMEWHNKHYSYLPHKDTAIAKRIPCVEENNVSGCPDFCLPTQQQIEQYKAETDEFIVTFLKRVNIARPAIVEAIKSEGKLYQSFSGTINCPICKSGQIEYGYAGAYNKHIRATCSTPDCVQWME